MVVCDMEYSTLRYPKLLIMLFPFRSMLTMFLFFLLVGESFKFFLKEQTPKACQSDLLTSDFMAYEVQKLQSYQTFPRLKLKPAVSLWSGPTYLMCCS